MKDYAMKIIDLAPLEEIAGKVDGDKEEREAA